MVDEFFGEGGGVFCSNQIIFLHRFTFDGYIDYLTFLAVDHHKQLASLDLFSNSLYSNGKKKKKEEEVAVKVAIHFPQNTVPLL